MTERLRAVTHCRSCGEQVVWLDTAGGKKMPVNLNTVDLLDQVFEYGRHVSHFSSCPQANQWRKARGSEPLRALGAGPLAPDRKP